LLLIDYWPLERKFNKFLLLEKIPFFAFALASCVITYICPQKARGNGFRDLWFEEPFCGRCNYYGEYLWKMIWPTKLAVLYLISWPI
jgi:hypothetical protein